MKHLGFGCMRLPLLENGEVDLPHFCKMVDLFLERGYTYFDTAHGYLDGKSELALRDGLTSRYPRDRYLLANKLSNSYFSSEAEIRPFFAGQLEACGVTWFDYYLFHALDAEYYEKYTACRAFETVQALKAEGKVRHVGMSFHDSAAVLDRILTDHPELEFVQLQFNYADMESPRVQSRACYEVCRRHGKPVFVMEPVKGGALAQRLPAEAAAVFAALGGGSAASYAVRFAAGFDGVAMVLSGMSSLDQMDDNTRFMQTVTPLNEAEQAAVAQVQEILRRQRTIPCTACRYCTAGCPAGIDIPAWFSRHNAEGGPRPGGGAPADCLRCGACESICPQHLAIRALLEKLRQE